MRNRTDPAVRSLRPSGDALRAPGVPASVALPDSGTVAVRIAVTCPKCDSDTFTVGKSDSLACALCLAEFESEPVSQAFAQRVTLAGAHSDPRGSEAPR